MPMPSPSSRASPIQGRLALLTIHDYHIVMKTIGTADLKAHLSEHLRAVREGESITVLDRREPIAIISPVGDKLEGLVTIPARGSLRDIPRPSPVGDMRDVVLDLLIERKDRF